MDSTINFRLATTDDLEGIVELLADDKLGKTRERYELPLPESYHRAFQAISSDPNNELVVACLNDQIVGVLQITFTPYLTYQGGWRATVEGVRICKSQRGQGLGSALIRWAIRRARERDCHLIQLTTDKKREDSLLFYERLGFRSTHEGLKMHLDT